ncbi:hypothetical protein MMC30_008375 [Trapelia coarctata]|nr:hypothetical protein [Trapelia coarctata]
MSTAEARMDPVIPDMAALFPWQSPKVPLNSALPWIEGAVTTVLSFVPFAGLLFKGAEQVAVPLISAISQSANSFANGGFQELQRDPAGQVLGTIHDLGLQVERDFKTAQDTLDSWSTAIFRGDTDISGRSIIDYMAVGRFTVNYVSQPPDSTLMADFYFQILVSKFANDQWLSNSKTFVMCTNSTSAPCLENSLYKTDNRTCCLYSLDDSNHYIPPPGLDQLSNSTYNIPPQNITASCLASYLTAAFNYTQDNFYAALDDQSALDPSQQAFSRGASFDGVWTQAVCDVPSEHAGWVANYSANLLPCCCGR